MIVSLTNYPKIEPIERDFSVVVFPLQNKFEFESEKFERDSEEEKLEVQKSLEEI